MFPTDQNRNGILAPLLADLFQEFLDRGIRIPKSHPENHIAVECVGDSKDAVSTSEQLETQKKEGPGEGSVSAAVPAHSPSKGQRKKSILTTESKTNPLYKEKLRQRMRLLFAPDVGTTSMPSKQVKEPSLGNKLRPSKDSAKLETRLDALAKRLLTLEANMDSFC